MFIGYKQTSKKTDKLNLKIDTDNINDIVHLYPTES